MSVFLGPAGGLKPCLEPRHLWRSKHARKNGALWVGKANAFACPAGPLPGRGFAIMRRGDLDTLNLNVLHRMRFRDNAVNFELVNVLIKDTYCLTASKLGSPNTAYVLELVDVRHLAMKAVVDKGYNVRAPAAAQNYYSDSLNGGVVWTWQTMLDNLWALVLAVAPEIGAAPTLPAVPAGTPENFRFHGVRAWDAYNEILAHVGMVFVLNPITGTPKIVQAGVADVVYTAAELARRPIRWDDVDPIRSPLAHAAATVRTYFHRQRDQYGTEKWTGWAVGEQDSMTPLYQIDTATGIANARAGTIHAVHDDLPARMGFDLLQPRNIADLTARATARTDDYVRGLATGGPQQWRQYIGFLTDTGLLPGSRVSGTAWYDTGHGWLTETVYLPSAHERAGEMTNWLEDAGYKSRKGLRANERLQQPDHSRATYPHYPLVMQPVYVVSGTPVPDVPRAYRGRVLRVDVESPVQPAPREYEDCLIWVADPRTTLETDDVVLGRLNGAFQSQGRQYPLYILGRTGGGGGFFPAIIRGNACPGFDFGWDEAQPVLLPWEGRWQVKPNGKNSDRDGRAYHLNLKQLVRAGTVVWMASNGAGGWVFDSAAGWTGLKLMQTDWECVNRVPRKKMEYFVWDNGELQQQPCPSQVPPCSPCPP